MRHVKFHLLLLAIMASLAFGISLLYPNRFFVYAQSNPTPTLNGASQPFITNTYTTEPYVNVRAGPSSVYYGDPIGQLPVNATALALAITAGHDWIEISFPAGSNGVGWVYAPFVTLTGSPPIIEPPPTFTPPALSTIDPTLLATFNAVPSLTRLPTYTVAAPLAIPTFPDSSEPPTHFPFGTIIVSLLIVGTLGLLVSLLGRR
jgi:hypothetical protein